jgi:hypothetical protein
MLNSKAKISSSKNVGAGILSWNNKRRHKASLGQKLFIISLNNNTIFSLTKNIQLVQGDYIMKNENIKINYNHNNDPIVLQVEDKRINIHLYSSATLKIIGIGKNVPKISLLIEEGNIITKYKNASYDFEISNSTDSVPVSITLKYTDSPVNTTLFYSDINLTKNNLLKSHLINNKNIESILIPYKSLTSELWNYFLNEILKFIIEHKISNLPIYLNEFKNDHLVSHMINRYNFEIIYKLFIDNFENNKIDSSNYLVQLVGGYDILENTSEKNIISWISSWLSEFKNDSGKFKQYFEKKVEESNIDNFIHFIIAYRISSGFLQVNQDDETEYIKNLQNIKNVNSEDTIYHLIQQTFIKYNFFNKSKSIY